MPRTSMRYRGQCRAESITPIGTQSLSDAQRATDALRPLTAVSARPGCRGHGDPAARPGRTDASHAGLADDAGQTPGTGSGPLTARYTARENGVSSIKPLAGQAEPRVGIEVLARAYGDARCLGL